MGKDVVIEVPPINIELKPHNADVKVTKQIVITLGAEPTIKDGNNEIPFNGENLKEVLKKYLEA